MVQHYCHGVTQQFEIQLSTICHNDKSLITEFQTAVYHLPTSHCCLTLKPYLGSLKTPEDQNASYLFNRLDVFAVNFHNPPHSH